MSLKSEQAEKRTIISLKKRALNASIWVLGGHFVSQAIRLASNLIMTRLLAPEMFGLMAMANLVMFGLHLFSDLGLNQNIIQSHREDKLFLDTIWTVQVARGFLVYLMACLLALGIYFINYMHWWPSGSVYSDPILPWIIAFISLESPIDGFRSVRISLSNRNLILRDKVLINLGSQVSGIIFMMIWVQIDRSVWALAAGSVMGTIVNTILSYTLIKGESNWFAWDKEAFAEIFHFGKWVFLSSILGFVSMSGDRIVLGGLIDTKQLGLYTIAYFMWSAVQEIVMKVLNGVALPVLSEVIRNKDFANVKRSYYRIRLPVDITSLFSMGFLMATAGLIIQILYDGRYMQAGFILQILAIGFFSIRYEVLNQFFVAMGKPRLLTPLIIINIVVIYTLLPIAYRFDGINGALWVIGGSKLASLPLIFYYKKQFNMLDIKKELMVLPVLPLGYLVGTGVHHLIEYVMRLHLG